MDSGDLAGSFQDEVTCPICLDYFTDPMSTECGHNFCQACLSQCWTESEPNFSCPQCRDTIPQRHLQPNYQLGNLVKLVKCLRLTATPAPEGQPGCQRHQELFYEEDQGPICVICRESRAHRAHMAAPIEDAAQECKRQTDVERQLVRWECKRLWQFLAEQERLLQAHLEELDEEIGRRREEHATRLVSHKPAPSRADTCLMAMASAATAGELEEEATCSICLEYLTEPVTIACGHNFCRACLTRHCEQQGAETPPACPQCRALFHRGQLTPNTQLRNIVQKLQQLGLKQGEGQSADLCERHQEHLKLFCQEDGAAICWVCEKSQVHKSHMVVPIEEAAQEYKEKLQGALGPLRKQLEEAKSLTSKEEKKTTEWQRKVQEKREMIVGEFNKLHTLLRVEEQLLLQKLAEEEETLRKLQENVTKLSQQSASLQQLIAEIEGNCQQPAVELLKDVKNTLSRSENMKLQEPDAVSMDLRHVYKICLDLREALNRFAVDVMLDPDTAHPKLVLSEGGKRVRWGYTRQDLPDNPERFDTCRCVLGAEGFRGGRRYWEVQVGDKSAWDLGVCRESVRRKGPVTLSPGNGYWAVWLRDGGYKALTSSPIPLLVSTRPSRVGIFLDYEAGEVSFYNVTDGSHLFTFTHTFSGTLRPYFYIGSDSAPMTICPAPAQAGGDPCPWQ